MSGLVHTMRNISRLASLIWIEEAHNSIEKPWFFFISLPHDEDYLVDLVQNMKKILANIHYKFDALLFCLAAKHKGKTQGNDKFICWLHWLYDFT